MRVLLLALAVLVLSGMSPEQDDFISENTSSSVRPTKAEALPQVDALDLEALARREGKWISVRDKVHSTHLANSQKIFMLNLDPTWQTCFKGVIFDNAFEKWDGRVSGLKNMSGGKVSTIEGELRMYQGYPEISVRVPSQIQVVK